MGVRVVSLNDKIFELNSFKGLDDDEPDTFVILDALLPGLNYYVDYATKTIRITE